jgi:hypothetical protein
MLQYGNAIINDVIVIRLMDLRFSTTQTQTFTSKKKLLIA